MRVAVIPARNEALHIGAVLNSLTHYVDTILVVDDASEDDTAQIAIDRGCVVISNRCHVGYGASIRTGLEWCRNSDASLVITLDGDDQHKAEWIQNGIPLVQAGADVVFANRFSELDGIPQTKLLSNNFAWHCVKRTIQKPPVCRDVSCGFRIYSRHSLKHTLEGANKATSGYAFTQATCTKLHLDGLRLAVLNTPAIYPGDVQGTAVSELRDFLDWLVDCTPLHFEARGWLEDLQSGRPLSLEFESWLADIGTIHAIAKEVDGFVRFLEV
jgi:glycosyltransferase involved in cell wall biosynthesis